MNSFDRPLTQFSQKGTTYAISEFLRMWFTRRTHIRFLLGSTRKRLDHLRKTTYANWKIAKVVGESKL